MGNRTLLTETIDGHEATSTAYTYDDTDQLVKEDRSGEVPFTIEYEYDPIGNRSAQTEDGWRKEFTYDAANRLLFFDRHPVTSSSASSESSASESESSSSSEAETSSQDSESESGQSSWSAEPESSESYESYLSSVSAASSGESEWGSESSPAPSPGSEESSSSASLDFSSQSSGPSQSSQSSSSASSWPHAGNFVFDANGNRLLQVIDGVQNSFAWNDDNRLVQWNNDLGGVESYLYDGDGLRRVRDGISGHENLVWDGDNLLQETDASGDLLASYTDFPGTWGGLVSQRRGSNSSFYYFDPSGNTRLLADEAGNVTDEYVYTAFGDKRDRVGTTVNIHGFGGEVGYQESSNGRVYVRQREYDPETGTWLSQDPLKWASGTLNFYGYCDNDPVNSIDPFGLAPNNDYSEQISGKDEDGDGDIAGRPLTYEQQNAPGSGGGAGSLGWGGSRGGVSREGRRGGSRGGGSGGAVRGGGGFVQGVKEFLGIGPGAKAQTAPATRQDAKPAANENTPKANVSPPSGKTKSGGTKTSPDPKSNLNAPKRVPNPGGRLGSPSTRLQIENIVKAAESQGFKLEAGGGRLREEFVRSSQGGPGVKGGTFIDITLSKNGVFFRINTVDTLADGVTLTTRELRNATRASRDLNGQILWLIPKVKTPRVRVPGNGSPKKTKKH